MKFVLTILFLAITGTSYCQTSAVTLSGKIVDSSNGQPLDNATVAVYTTGDDSMLAYYISNTNGNFKIPALPENARIKIVISFFGYAPCTKEITTTDNGLNGLGTIEMVPEIKTMETVVVRAKKHV